MTVLVLPRETFSSESKLAKILDFLGWKISHDPDADSDLVIWHNDDVPVHIGIKGSPPIVNWRTKLIDKARVNNVFENVFGYKIGVDPTTYHQRSGWKPRALARLFGFNLGVDIFLTSRIVFL